MTIRQFFKEVNYASDDKGVQEQAIKVLKAYLKGLKWATKQQLPYMWEQTKNIFSPTLNPKKKYNAVLNTYTRTLQEYQEAAGEEFLTEIEKLRDHINYVLYKGRCVGYF